MGSFAGVCGMKRSLQELELDSKRGGRRQRQRAEIEIQKRANESAGSANDTGYDSVLGIDLLRRFSMGKIPATDVHHANEINNCKTTPKLLQNILRQI